MKYIVTNILYDTDGKNIDLPRELTIEVSDDLTDDYDKVEFISDEISNITGFCHSGFCTTPTLSE